MQISDPDIRLMLAFREGDEAALSELYRKWAGPLLRYLARLEIDRSEHAETSAPEGLSSSTTTKTTARWRRWGVPSALAAAAALVIYLVLPATKPMTEEPSSLNEGAIPVADGASSADAARDPRGTREGLEEDLALILGYGDDTSEIGAISNDDLDVIERLDLLDFLSAGEMEKRG
jgi:hypothetical protein